jgi:hypothetical protein
VGLNPLFHAVKLIGVKDNADYLFLSFEDLKTGEIKKIPHPLK